MLTLFRPLTAATVLAALAVVSTGAQESFRFRSGVELVNVTASVTDDDGRFVSGLRQEDFTVYEDGEEQSDLALQQRACAGQPRDRCSTPAAA